MTSDPLNNAASCPFGVPECVQTPSPPPSHWRTAAYWACAVVIVLASLIGIVAAAVAGRGR